MCKLMKKDQTPSRKEYEKSLGDVTIRTKQSYSTALNNFEEFCYKHTKTRDMIPKLQEYTEEQLWDFLQAWIDNNYPLDPSSVRIFFSHIKRYLFFFGIKMANQEVSENLEFLQTNKKEPYLLVKKELKCILSELSYKDNALYLCQISSGLGISELVLLTKSNLSYTNHRMVVTVPSNKRKIKRTVSSKEATDKIKPLLRVKEADEPIFGTNKNTHYSVINKEQVLRRALTRCELDMTYPDTRRHKICPGSFRYFNFMTIGEQDYNFSCYLNGCENRMNLDKFEKMSDKELVQKYIEIEESLTIF